MSKEIKTGFNLNDCKYHFTDPALADCFVENGFVIVEKVFDLDLVNGIYEILSGRYLDYKARFIAKLPGKKVPYLGISKQVLSDLKSEGLYENLMKSDPFLDALEKLFGPDLAMVNVPSLWINDPDDNSVVTNKSLHQEVWTGSSVNHITAWIPYHGITPGNTMSVIPGSHYFGFLPNQNRNLICPENFELPESLPLAPLTPGCAILFHSLLLHETTGRGKDIRYATSHIIKNTLAPPTAQEQTYGYTTLRSSPLNKIKIGLGNDFLSPLRTYGGPLSNNQSFDPSDLL